MDSLNLSTANNFNVNPFLNINNSGIASSDSLSFNQSDFMSSVYFPSTFVNTPFPNLPFSGTNFNMPFMGTNFNPPFMNINFNLPFINYFSTLPPAAPTAPTGNFNSNISWTNNFSRKTFTPRENQLINEIAQRINCNPNDLKALMYSESGCRPNAVNRNGGATGIIQFMPATARSLGTTTQQLRNMSIEQQLPYVERYLARVKRDAGIPSGQRLDAGTLYALTFLPAFAKREILCSAGSNYYNANRGLDRNRDGHITKTDLANRLASYA